jgi:hypothetical protein
VGGTAVGKSSLLKYIANVLLGNDIDHYDLDILDRSPNKGSAVGRTALPHLYEIRSVSGLLVSARVSNEMRRHNLLPKVRILDTPGLAGIHDIEQDEIRKEVMVRFIEQHVESISAVLILAVDDIPLPMEYTFSSLSAIFPKSLANNIAFVFTIRWDPLTWKFSEKMVPATLKSSPVFRFCNPITHEKDFLNVEIKLQREQSALETLVNLFNWLDDLEPQPATEIVSFYEKYQNIEAKLDQGAREVETDRLMNQLQEHSAVSLSRCCLHLAFESYARCL